MALTSIHDLMRAGDGVRPKRVLVKAAIFLTVIVPVIWLLSGHLAEMDRAQVAAGLRAIPVEALALSALFTLFSLIAVARYDIVAMRQLGLNLPDRLAIRGGFTAIGLGQTLGLGLLVGTFVRWRFYRHQGVSLAQAGLISGLVAAGFLAGFAVVLALAVLWRPVGLEAMTDLSSATLRGIAIVVLAGAGLFGLAALAQPRVRLFGRRLAFPRARVLRAQVVLAALDTVPAAAALWVLIPAGSGLDLWTIVPVYLAALGVGLLSNTPGGLGVLELACLAALPVLPPEDLLAALIAHRAIYYGAPALLAAAILVAREVHGTDGAETSRRATTLPRAPSGQVPAEIAPLLANSDAPEAALARLGDKEFLMTRNGRAALMVRASGNSLVAMGTPLGDRAYWPELVHGLKEEAHTRLLTPVVYKATGAFAEDLRSAGMMLTRIGQDASVDAETFSLEGSKRRELRRKLRSAEKAGVETAVVAPEDADFAELAPVAAAWASAKGGERGFSMGRFCPDYLADAPMILARQDGKVIGFLSLWTTADGEAMSLDVMRIVPDAPDGSMHALVAAGIAYAQRAGAKRFDLCAVPFAGIDTPQNALERAIVWVRDKRANWIGGHGLMRFKSSFRPDWAPRYLAAPGPITSLCGGRDAMALIHDTPRAPKR